MGSSDSRKYSTITLKEATGSSAGWKNNWSISVSSQITQIFVGIKLVTIRALFYKLILNSLLIT